MNEKVRDKCFLSSKPCVSLRLISRSTVDGTRLRCHSRSRRSSVCQDFSGFPRRDAGSGSVGRIRVNRDGRTTTSEALRFNIVISVAFAEQANTYRRCTCSTLRTPGHIEYTISFLIFQTFLFSLFTRFPSSTSPRTQRIPFVLFERNS